MYPNKYEPLLRPYFSNKNIFKDKMFLFEKTCKFQY